VTCTRERDQFQEKISKEGLTDTNFRGALNESGRKI
jgi:hypothetical protein